MSETKKRILIVDDDVSFVESNKDLLEAEGFEILAAHDGATGLELAKKEKPDLMILDAMMASESEGFEVSRKIAETPGLADMKVLLVTGIVREMHLPFKYSPDETWLPVDNVIDKPVPPEKLLAAIRNLIG